jgi:hypothetical protein
MMNDQELKKLLEESTEGPSYGFSTKTMRKIEAIEASKTSLSFKDNKSVVGYLIPTLFLALLITAFFLREPQFGSIDLTMPTFDFNWPNFNMQSINIHFTVLIASIGIAAGFWVWIWWEKRNFRFR